MLLRHHVLNALAFHYAASPLVVGDTIGEDKFRVLEVMRGLVAEGAIKPLWAEGPYESDRVESDRQHYFIPGVSDDGIGYQQDYVQRCVRVPD